jgi:CheY-like chemotaxis protein/HPt (histidine-containing phosphotransfer) domain-containing protein
MRDASGEDATRILVAEDHPTNQAVVQSMLRRLGYGCTLAADGVETLAALEAEPGVFATVLMDCHMPNLDGYDATRLIRARERDLGYRRLPILAVTASVFPEDRRRAEEAGMDGFLAKPVELSTLREALAAAVRDSVRDAPPEPRATATSMAARAHELLLIGGADLLADVRRLFTAEAERFAAALTERYDAGDHVAVRGIAHTLKGTSLNVGAERLAELARRLELRARAGALVDGEEDLGALLTELTSVTEAMRAWPQ